MKLTLTTNHAASSYGLPVLVDENRNAYGPADTLPTGELARDFVARKIRAEGEKLLDVSLDLLDLLTETPFERAFLGLKFTSPMKKTHETDPAPIDFAAADKAAAAALNELSATLDPNSYYSRALAQAVSKVPAALAQLNGSERGQQALADFRTLLKNGGSGLDPQNWAALATLCRASGRGL